MKTTILTIAVALSTTLFAQVPSESAYVNYSKTEEPGILESPDDEVYYAPSEKMYLRMYSHTPVDIMEAMNQFAKDTKGKSVSDRSYIPDFVDADDYYMLDLVTEQEKAKILKFHKSNSLIIGVIIDNDNVNVFYQYL